MTAELIYTKQQESADGPIIQKIPHKTPMKQIQHPDEIDEQVEQVWRKLITFIFNNEVLKGSGYQFNKFESLDIELFPYTAKNIGSYIQLQKDLKCVNNIQNKDDYCFIYCYLLGLYLSKYPKCKNMERSSGYKFKIKDNQLMIDTIHKQDFKRTIDIKDIKFPFQMKDLNKLEKALDCTFNIYTIIKNDHVALRVTKQKNKSLHMNFCVIESYDEDTNKTNSHCLYINNLDAFLSVKTSKTNKIYACETCTQSFYKKEKLQEHIPLCQQLQDGDCAKMEFGKYKWLKFNSFQKMNKNPYTVYADFESLLVKREQKDQNDNTVVLNDHVPISYCLYFKSYQDNDNKLITYKGSDCVDHFYNQLKNIERFVVKDIDSNRVPMKMTKNDEIDFQNAKVCYLCTKEFDKNYDMTGKVRDHDHYTGKYRGAAHNKCNLDYNLRKGYKIPVLFHNLKNYDAHFLISSIFKHLPEKDPHFQILATNNEKFISFEWQKFRFLDSFAFLPSSISKLANNLTNEQKVLTKQHFKHLSEEDFIKFNSKGVFPYNWFDSQDKLKYKHLPSQNNFYDELNDKECSITDYQQAQWVWKTFKCKTFEDYHDLYLIMDVLLLVDIFEQFKITCLENYRLDPSFYYTSPGLSWDAMLLYTKVTFELIDDIDMYNMIENGMRGGISTANYRYAEANNKYMQNYDKNKEQSFIQYHDANNLYGWAMSQYLPVKDFQWLEEKSLQLHKSLIKKHKENDKYGYIYEVDLEYPQELHEKHNNLPLAPENIQTSDYDLSKFNQNILNKMNNKDDAEDNSKCSKLTPNLNDKNKYVLHIRNLQYYLSQGLVLKKVHRAIRFIQKPYLKPYIEKNTELRKQAKNSFEKDFFKLMNNSVFGKTMENVRKRSVIKPISSKKQYDKALQSHLVKNLTSINEDLSLAHYHKTKVTLNKPIYCGMVILDLSKLVMYKYLYNHIYNLYDHKNVKLCYMDTDSFILNIKTNDFYQDMIDNHLEYDLSEYTNDHPIYQMMQNQFKDQFIEIIDHNKKKPGVMKDESGSYMITNVIALRSKVYAYKTTKDTVGKRLKGIKSNVTDNQITYQNYHDCLFKNQIFQHKQKTFKSNLHKITTIEQQKISLCSYNDKRYVLDDRIETLAIGNYKINEKP